uniref:Uncharacterized protein n=1 Tax=Myripristis murdjan TaxID=586833 RepID=A0A668ALY8_9TELE
LMADKSSVNLMYTCLLMKYCFSFIFSIFSPQQSLFTLSVFAVTLLAPAGWIMHHIPVYRQRPRPQP